MVTRATSVETGCPYLKGCHRYEGVAKARCAVCRHNLYLYDGSCVETCPDDFIGKRPSWVSGWKREIGGTCERKGNYAVVKAWGDSSSGRSAP